MKFIEYLQDKLIGGYVGLGLGGNGLRDHVNTVEESYIRSQENTTSIARDEQKLREAAGLAEIELALEDMSWRDMAYPYGSWNFTRMALRKMAALSRIMYLVNPLIKRAITVQELYVWGSGCTIKADDPTVQEVLDDFFKDPKNQKVIGDSWAEREREQRIEGNTFFVFFVNKINGTFRVRLLPVDQIEEILTNPDDAKEPWYYKRAIVQDAENPGGMQWALYPNIDYNPYGQRPFDIGGIPIKWDAKILHVKTGGLSSMKFGIPELFAALNWATAYKKILENFATILAAYARVAMQIKGNAGKKGVSGAKSKLNTGINGATGPLVDGNPPTNTAAWFLSSGNVELSAVKTAHSTTGPDEARALRSMVAAGSDTPEHFFGDSDIGNFATSTTLDRPTELKMISRQSMWVGVIQHMIDKIIEGSATAYNGKLRAKGFRTISEYDKFDGSTLITVIAPKGKSTSVSITFPDILQREVVDRVRAIIQAATLGGSSAEGIFPDRKFLFHEIMVALGRKDADKVTDEYYPNPVLQGFADPTDVLKVEQDKAKAAILKAKSPTLGPNKSTPTGNTDVKV